MGPVPLPGAVYELTVLGAVGPVLRAVLEPIAATTSSGVRTVVCLRGHDLQEVVELLRCRGLEPSTVRTLDRNARSD